MSPFIALLTAIKKLLAFKVDRDEFRDVIRDTKKDIEGIKNDIEDTKREIEDAVEEVESNIAQSDWNQNDETAPDYIKNRPFYENAFLRNVVCKEQTVTLQDGEYSYFEYDTWTEQGVEYVVVFDGVEYPVVCWSDSDACYRLDFTHTSGVRVTIMDSAIEADGLAGEHTFAVYKDEIGHKRIDKKFLPEDIVSDIKNLQIAAKTAQTTADSKMNKTDPVGTGAFSLNRKTKTTVGPYSTTIGKDSIASGNYSYAGGVDSSAGGDFSYAEGNHTIAFGLHSRAVGDNTIAPCDYVQAFGSFNKNLHVFKTFSVQTWLPNNEIFGYSVDGAWHQSDRLGFFFLDEIPTTPKTVKNVMRSTYVKDLTEIVPVLYDGEIHYACKSLIHVTENYRYSTTQNRIAYEVKQFDYPEKYLCVVGNGESDDNRSNAHTLDWDGNAWYAGTLRVGGTSYDDAKEVALKEDIPQAVAKTDNMTQPIGVDESGLLWTAPGSSTAGLGDFRLIRSVTVPTDLSADTNGVTWLARESGGYWFGFDTDLNGATFDLKELVVICEGVASAGGDLTWRFNSGATPFYGSGTTIGSYSPTENKAWQWIYFLGAFTQYIGCKNNGANVNNAQANRYMLTDRPISSVSSISTYHNNGNAYGITAGTIHFYGR